ncbi:MAG: NAD(P)/FAD-dependent oxidoreductase, partial [Cyanobacteria bacterium P01_H01_bin.130]
MIVGAGPAGATASLFLAEQGIKHAIVDSATFPRDKVDGNVFGDKVLKTLEPLQGGQVRQRLMADPQFLQFEGGLRGYGFNEESLRAFWPGQDPKQGSRNYTMARRYFDQVLVESLDPNFATVQLGTKVTALRRDADAIVMTVEGPDGPQEWRSQYILGADGEKSIVRRALSPEPERPSEDCSNTLHAYYSGVTQEGNVPYAAGYLVPSAAGQWFGRRSRFVYVAPLADGLHKVGFIGYLEEDGPTLERELEDALTTHPALKKRFAQATRVGEVGIWPASHNRPALDNVVSDRVLLAGDAASLLLPFLGFGTGNAMLSGRLAAETLGQAIAAERSDAAFLEKYAVALRRELKTGIKT